MSVASEIVRIKNNITNAYDAISTAGGTLPAEHNSANLASAVKSIPIGDRIYGMTVQDILGRVDSTGALMQNGKYGPDFSTIKTLPAYAFYTTWKVQGSQEPASGPGGIIPFGFTQITADYCCYQAFYGRTGILEVNFNDLTDITGPHSFEGCFMNCTGIGSASLSKLTTVNGAQVIYQMFYGDNKLRHLDISNLTSVSGSSAARQFAMGCTNLQTINVSKLTTVNGSSAMSQAFQGTGLSGVIRFTSLQTINGASAFANIFNGCTGITEIYFPSLTTVGTTSSLNNFIAECTGLKYVHFRSDMETVIKELSGYSTGFGYGSPDIIKFDL